ncbi:chemotaxis protein CheW [Aliiroseovarius sp. PTFE2010]|uniref:chemotaxis protein CheW n=1 Tax=Aliiroseovarius sp. PTFE2010 TaxID=3417190 RepID=UPI003CE741FB
MTENTKQTESAIELLSFRVGGQDYSVDIMAVREIRGSAKATSLPHAPAFVKGVINLRGTVLPIIDLAARLGIETGAETERNVIIVVDLGERTAGLMVDAVSDILAIPESEMQPPPDLAADEAHTFVSALTIVEGRMIRILDLNSVLPPQNEEAA